MNAISWNQLGCTLVLVCLAGCMTEPATLDRSQEYLRRANYYQAYAELRQQHGDETPTDPSHRAVTVGYLLSMGQEQVFDDEELAAIEIFAEVLRLDPDNSIAADWIEKCRRKLAGKAVARGDAHTAADEISEALVAYDEALKFKPGHAEALAGVDAVAERVASRKARAEDHYARGLEVLAMQLSRQVSPAVTERFHAQALYHMKNAVALDPDHEMAQDRRDRALSQLIRAGFERAKSYEEAGFYGAAEREYLWIQEVSPDAGSVEQHIDHMRRELAAAELVTQAEKAGLAGEFEAGRKLLEQAYQTSISQRPRIVELLVLVKEGESEKQYGEARVLEFENRKEGALALYRSIDEEWQGQGYKDVKARVSGLEADIAEATAAWERGKKAEDGGAWGDAVEAYEEALLFYPGFKALDSRIAELKQKL